MKNEKGIFKEMRRDQPGREEAPKEMGPMV